MAPHIHIGLVEFLAFGAQLLIFTFLWRAFCAWRSETSLGRGAAAVYT